MSGYCDGCGNQQCCCDLVEQVNKMEEYTFSPPELEFGGAATVYKMLTIGGHGLFKFVGPTTIKKLHVAGSGHFKLDLFVHDGKSEFVVPPLPESAVYTTLISWGGSDIWGWRLEEGESLYGLISNSEDNPFEVYISGAVMREWE